MHTQVDQHPRWEKKQLTRGTGNLKWAMFMFFFRGTVILFGRTSRAAMKSWISESDITLQVGKKKQPKSLQSITISIRMKEWGTAKEMGTAKWVILPTFP